MCNLPLMEGGQMSRRNVHARWTQKGDPKGLLQRLGNLEAVETGKGASKPTTARASVLLPQGAQNAWSLSSSWKRK